MKKRSNLSISALSKDERVGELLRLLGHDAISIEQFWSEMRNQGLTDEDIDRFCTGLVR